MVPKPVAQAVMFCLMDVSGSMDRAHEGLGKALLTPAIYFPEAALQVMSKWFSSDIRTRRRKSMRIRSFTAPKPAERWSRPRSRKCPRHRRTGIPGSVEHLRGPGVGRRQPAIDNDATDALLKSGILPVLPVLRLLEVGREPERSPPGVDRRDTSGRPTISIQSPEAPMAMRKVRDRRDIYPVFRELFARGESASAGAWHEAINRPKQ